MASTGRTRHESCGLSGTWVPGYAEKCPPRKTAPRPHGSMRSSSPPMTVDVKKSQGWPHLPRGGKSTIRMDLRAFPPESRKGSVRRSSSSLNVRRPRAKWSANRYPVNVPDFAKAGRRSWVAKAIGTRFVRARQGRAQAMRSDSGLAGEKSMAKGHVPRIERLRAVRASIVHKPRREEHDPGLRVEIADCRLERA